MNTIWILIIMYAGAHTATVELTSKEKCYEAIKTMNEIGHGNGAGWFRRELYCVEKQYQLNET